MSNDTAVNLDLSTWRGQTPASDRTAKDRVEPDIDTIVTFLKTVYPVYPKGVLGVSWFTATNRCFSDPTRMGEWPADDRGGPYIQDHVWLAEAIAKASERKYLPTGKEWTEHPEYAATGIPVTGVFLRTPTTMAEWPEKGRRGGQGNVCELIGFIADGDFGTEGHKRNKDDLPNPKDADEVQSIWAEALGGQPTMTWISGNGINGFWGLKTSVRVPDGEEGAVLLKAWRAAHQRFHERIGRTAGARGLHHDSVPNNDRLMRVAGTVNAKAGTTPKLSVLLTTDGPRYTLADLFALAPEPIETEDGTLVDAITGEVVRAARKHRIAIGGGSFTSAQGGYEAGETSWAHFSREMWETGGFLQMIEADGFTQEGFHGGTLHLWRPGKGAGEQISATFGANEGVGAMSYGAKFYSFSDNAPGLLGTPTWKGGCLGRFVDPHEYVVFTRYNGDFKAAARELYRKGYGARYVQQGPEETETDRIKRVAQDAVQVVRSSIDWQPAVARQALVLASEGVPEEVASAVLLGCRAWGPEKATTVTACISAAYRAAANAASA